MADLSELPKGVHDRLEYLEFMLRFRGWVSRADLTERFGLGEAAATRDIRLYKEFAGQNLELNQSTKKYEICEDEFKPIFELPVQVAISKLRNSKICEALGMAETDGILCPPRLVLPNIEFIALITRAIASQASLQVTYRSVGSGLSDKTLLPHALFDNGIHWYVRAYDVSKSKFHSYALTRFVKIAPAKNESRNSDLKLKDYQWNRMVPLELIPHPNMDNVKGHPETIEHDFNMEDGVLKIMARASVVGYWLHFWNVDCTEDHSLKGYNYQLWLRNHQTLYDVESRGIAPGLSEFQPL